MSEDQLPLDAAINRTAQALTAHPPPSTVGQVVRARITANRTASVTWSWRLWIWRCGFAVVAVVVALLVWPGGDVTGPGPARETVAVRPLTSTAAPGPPDVNRVPEAPTRSARASRSPERPSALQRAGEFAPLTIVPIAVERLGGDGPAQDTDVELMALEIEPISVPRLAVQ